MFPLSFKLLIYFFYWNIFFEKAFYEVWLLWNKVRFTLKKHKLSVHSVFEWINLELKMTCSVITQTKKCLQSKLTFSRLFFGANWGQCKYAYSFDGANLLMFCNALGLRHEIREFNKCFELRERIKGRADELTSNTDVLS